MTADDYLKNEGWVQRTEAAFTQLDRDKDGVISITDVVIESKKFAHLNPDPEVIERYRIAQCEFAAEMGIKPGISVTKEEYVKNLAAIAPREVAKVRSGEGSMMHKGNNKLFDVIDKNHDGTVSKEEYRAFAEATGVWEPSFVDSIFDLIDTNKNGKLERKELSDYVYKLTFTLDSVAGMDQVMELIKPAEK